MFPHAARIEKGRVTAIRGGMATVELPIQDGGLCMSCGLCTGRGNKTMAMEVEAAPSLSIGDTVTVSVSMPSLVHAMILLFAIPLAGLFMGMLAGGYLVLLLPSLQAYATALSLVLGFALMSVAYVIAWQVDRRIRLSNAYGPRIVAEEPTVSTGEPNGSHRT